MGSQIIMQSDEQPKILERVLQLYGRKVDSDKNQRLIISLAGIPGSGKTTFSSKLSKKLNSIVKSKVLPQDGFHYYRSELEKMPNPAYAVERRGAPFTFNVEAFLALIKKLNDPAYSDKTITAPSFDHEKKDPVEDDIIIDGETRIVIIEGNYVSLKDPYWNEIESYVDESWFIDTPLEITIERIIKRHLEAGICSTLEEASERANGSDALNSKYILKNSKSVDVKIITKPS